MNFSKGMMGGGWPKKEWETNMVELEVSIVLRKENVQTKSNFFTVDGFST